MFPNLLVNGKQWTGERLEQDRQAERFEVIEQATVPTNPIEPNRRRIAMAGGFGGVAVGMGLVVLLELLDNRLYSTAELEKRLQLRPIATIPILTTINEKRRRRRLIIASSVGAIVVFIAILAAIDSYYMPLDLFLEGLLRRLDGWLPSVGLIS